MTTPRWPPRWLVVVMVNVIFLGLATMQLWGAGQRQQLVDSLVSCGATVQSGKVTTVTSESSSGEPLAVDVRFADGTTTEVEISGPTEIIDNQVGVRRCPDRGLALSEADFSEGNAYYDAVGTALLMAAFSVFLTWLIIKLAPP